MFIITSIQQLGGGTRYIGTRDRDLAIEAREAINADPARVDGLWFQTSVVDTDGPVPEGWVDVEDVDE